MFGGILQNFPWFWGVRNHRGASLGGGFRFCRERWAPTDTTHPGGVGLSTSALQSKPAYHVNFDLFGVREWMQ